MHSRNDLLQQFCHEGTIASVQPLAGGLINDTFLVRTAEADKPDYVLQRINHHVFTDVDLLQHNIETVTDYLNGDTYYKTTYPEHNLIRTRNQLRLFMRVQERRDEMLLAV